MSSLRQHFQRLKEIVDWSWTLAIMCMVGYITLGQLVQLYWTMVFFGGLAASFGLFYDFSCEKLVELNSIEDEYKLQKVFAASALAQDWLRVFANRNPEIASQFPEFVQIRNQVSNIRATSAARIKQSVNRQTQTPPQSSSQPPSQKLVQPNSPSPAPQRERGNPLRTSSQKPVQPNLPSLPPRRKPEDSLRRANRQKITQEEYKRIFNQSDYVYVKAHLRKGKFVKAHYRRKPRS